MSEQQNRTRPSQVTMAGWMALMGSVFLVLTLFESIGRLRTVEFRDEVDEFLSTPPGSGLGLDIPQVVEILRWLMLFSGAAAAAATVLAIFVLQRNNGARIGFTVAAVAIMLTAPVSGGFLPVLIAFAAIMLWTKPARAWFAGAPESAAPASDRMRAFGAHQERTPVDGSLSSEGDSSRDRPGRPDDDSSDQSWPRMPEDTSDRPLPPPTRGFGSGDAEQSGHRGAPSQQGSPSDAQGQHGHPGQQDPYRRPGGPSYQGGYPPHAQGGYPPYGQQPPPGGPRYGQPYGQPYGPPYGQGGYGQQYSGSGHPGRRPTTVTVAAWLTWGLATLTVVAFVLVGVVMLAARDQFLRQLERDQNFQQMNLPTEQVVGALWLIGVVVLFWSVAAMVLAWFAYRGANWARITLVVSSAMTVLVSLAAFPVGILHTLGAGAVIGLLFLGGANEWFSGESMGSQGFAGPAPPYGQQYAMPPYGQQDPAQRQPGGSPDYSRQDPPQPGQQGQSGPQGQPGREGQPGQGYGEEPEPPRRPEDPSRGRGKDEPPSNVW